MFKVTGNKTKSSRVKIDLHVWIESIEEERKVLPKNNQRFKKWKNIDYSNQVYLNLTAVSRIMPEKVLNIMFQLLKWITGECQVLWIHRYAWEKGISIKYLVPKSQTHSPERNRVVQLIRVFTVSAVCRIALHFWNEVVPFYRYKC